jgi:hypothetical protein
MTVQRENFDVAATEVVQEAESVLEGTPVVEPVPAPPAEVPKPDKKEDPEVTPMCCGMPPGPMMLVGNFEQAEHVHEADCPNNPDNLAQQEVVAG